MVKGLTYVWRYSFFILIGKQTVNALSWRFKFSSPQVTTVPEIIFSRKKGVSTIQEHSRHVEKKLIQVEQVPEKSNNRTPLRFTDSTNPVPEPLAIQCNDLKYECNTFCIETVV